MKNQNKKLTRIILALTGFSLFIAIGAGLFFLTITSGQSIGLALSFAAGLSMIFLPCTLPLVFIIVPMTLGKSPVKGFIMAVLFGLGISITLAIYGVIVSQFGGYFGLDKFTQYLFLFAGIVAILFGLAELNFIHISFPKFIGISSTGLQNRSDYIKALGMGMLLGNAGIGCPNPAFYVVLIYIAGIGSLGTGAELGFVHGLGRAVPLLLIVILAILGVNTTKWIVSRQESINKITAWSLVAVGSFILTYGLWGMHWWEASIFHTGWNQFIINIAPALAEKANHPMASAAFTGPTYLAWWTGIGIILAVMVWDWIRKKKISISRIIVAIALIILGILSSTNLLTAESSHRVKVANNNFEIEQSLKLSGNSKSNNIKKILNL